MPVIPTRFPVRFGDVFPLGCFVLGGEPSNALVWTVRALDANEEAARFGAEFKVKVAAEVQPVPPMKASGFPYPAAEFEDLTITPYAGRNGRIAYSFRASGMHAPHVGRAKPDPGEVGTKSAAA
ncbi:hypothetical protein [Lentzea albidocapillata]|uniref:Plasmid replication, integration and excision activator n=1 Tax=Lentzea albidocapillata TaxID=40571 RepID=A0A1W2FKP8_9PSEU|nr:hypothetical protein [Lentzea albidocapillata]SMD22324.1 hypothetical protein SAMN05660733_06754 [Lentzea albidocapillata]